MLLVLQRLSPAKDEAMYVTKKNQSPRLRGPKTKTLIPESRDQDSSLENHKSVRDQGRETFNTEAVFLLDIARKFFVGVNFWTSFRHFLPIHLFFSSGVCKKNVAARCDFQAQNTQNCVSCRFASNPTGEITELTRPPSWFSGSGFAAGKGRGKGEEGRERGKGKGIT